jgi:hypothetical protein
MPFNIDQFRANGLTGGGARPSLFDVEITNWPLHTPTSSQKFKFTCSATEIPAATIGSIDVPYFGRQIKLAGDRTFADWNVTVQNDEDFDVRFMFENWSNAINQLVANKQVPIGGSNIGYKSADAIIRQYGRSGSDDILRSYKMVGIFPTNIGNMALDWDATNRIQTFDVTFSYDFWVIGDEGSSSPIDDGYAD